MPLGGVKGISYRYCGENVRPSHHRHHPGAPL
jgi:hypothetical protein